MSKKGIVVQSPSTAILLSAEWDIEKQRALSAIDAVEAPKPLTPLQEKLMELEAESKVSSAMREKEQKRKEDYLKTTLKNVFDAMVKFSEEMIATVDMDTPWIRFCYLDREQGMEDVATFTFSNKRYLDSGSFMIPLLMCDWENEDSLVELDIYNVLKFNLRRGLSTGYGGHGYLKIFTSSIWDKDTRASKLLRRTKIHRDAVRKQDRYEKFLELSKEFAA